MKIFKSLIIIIFSVAGLFVILNSIGAHTPSASSERVKISPLILVNSSHPFSGEPDNLVSIYENKNSFYFVKDKNVLIHKSVMKPLNRMMEDFYKETCLKTVNIISGYRSIQVQKEIYNEKKSLYGKDYADKYVQKPGKSEHHTGLALDLALWFSESGTSEDFSGKGEYSWFSENCYKYGFIQRYEQEKESITGIAYEPWHFRYVGKKAAKAIYSKGICLEEYLNAE